MFTVAYVGPAASAYEIQLFFLTSLITIDQICPYSHFSANLIQTANSSNQKKAVERVQFTKFPEFCHTFI